MPSDQQKMTNNKCVLLLLLLLLLIQLAILPILSSLGASAAAAEQVRVLLPGMIPVRSQAEPEWDEFPAIIGNTSIDLRFAADTNLPWTLQISQQDLKQVWDVMLNDHKLGRLERDENLQVVTFAIPADQLHDLNRLRIQPSNHKSSDDVFLGNIRLISREKQEFLSEGKVHVQVFDGTTASRGKIAERIPVRLTVTRADGALAALGNESEPGLAVRNGVLYSLSGDVDLKLPAGDYTIYASRGMEWSLAQQQITVTAEQPQELELSIRRIVPTEGWVASDTHVHTLTFSGHGDSSIEERMSTLAGEGIEFPIATDHNVHIDYTPHARKVGANKFFTPVIGNEVTTKLGHFNVFPIRGGAETPNHKAEDWSGIFESIFATPDVGVVILNHSRDLHSNFKPFGPENHIAIAGENINGWELRANAMEVINSGATQTNPYQLFHDWLGLLNRGLSMTPVGCSDSHDVARHFVGQGRTYIKVDDTDPGNISIADAVRSFREGRVVVSYGLFAKITVNGKFGVGDLATTKEGEPVEVAVEVYGPDWCRAERVRLFANGRLVGTKAIDPDDGEKAGLKFTAKWRLESHRHDAHLVAIVDGPGVTAPYWPMAKAYQPTSTHFEPRARSMTGAVWLDGDRNQRRDTPFDYATRLVQRHGDDLTALVAESEQFDAPTRIQIASVLRKKGISPLDPRLDTALEKAPENVRRSFAEYRDAWRSSEKAKAGE
jgi:hypothetical protein